MNARDFDRWRLVCWGQPLEFITEHWVGATVELDFVEARLQKASKMKAYHFDNGVSRGTVLDPEQRGLMVVSRLLSERFARPCRVWEMDDGTFYSGDGDRGSDRDGADDGDVSAEES